MQFVDLLLAVFHKDFTSVTPDTTTIGNSKPPMLTTQYLVN